MVRFGWRAWVKAAGCNRVRQGHAYAQSHSQSGATIKTLVSNGTRLDLSNVDQSTWELSLLQITPRN
jgi:hypothetical protein